MTRVATAAGSLALLLITFFLFTPILTEGDLGLCLPSPNQWRLPHFGGWIINTAVIFLATLLIVIMEKNHNFTIGAHELLPAALLILLSTNCLTTYTLSTSSLLLCVNAICLFILLSTYEERNATRQYFLIATFPSIGAMLQYAFPVMIPAYIAGGLLMKSFRIKEFIAFILGLLAPWWIAIGLGWVSDLDFHLPERLTVFSTQAVENDIFLTIVAAGIMAISGVMISFYTGVRLFSRNSRLRCMQFAFDMVGVMAILGMVFDFNNFAAYFGTVALWLAIRIATLVSLYEIRRRWVVPLILAAIFLPLYILALT